MEVLQKKPFTVATDGQARRGQMIEDGEVRQVTVSADKGGRLTTHVLDTGSGRPAGGLRISLFRMHQEKREWIKTVTTNEDGRCDQPLLAGDALQCGNYELVFDAGDYFRSNSTVITEPAFLDQIPIRFGVADTEQHYHVPLLVSAYSYSTYRGS